MRSFSILSALLLVLMGLNLDAKNKRFDSRQCRLVKQTYGSVLECGEDLYSVPQKSSVEKSLEQICTNNFKCQLTFEVNGRDEVAKVHSAFAKGKKYAKTYVTSFDCQKAQGFAEQIVCTDTELADLDNRLGAEVKKAQYRSDKPKKVRDAHKAWLQAKRNACQDKECLKKVYELRLEEVSRQ
jgi:hypothetical protein